jgi:hypothetical protein
MGRLLGVLSLAVLAAGVLSGAALAKEMGVELSSTPAGIEPGEPWTPTLYLLAGPPELFADAKPGVRIQNIETGERTRFRARPTTAPLEYDVRVVFPDAGWYTVEAFSGVTGRSYRIGGQWLIQRPEATLPRAGEAVPSGVGAAVEDRGSFPVWPALAGGTVFLLAAAGARLYSRRAHDSLGYPGQAP